MLDYLKAFTTPTPAPTPATPPPYVLPPKVQLKQKELRYGVTQKAVKRLTDELAKARETAARSKTAFQECLATGDDPTAAKVTMKQHAGEVAELESDLANAEEVDRQAKRELEEAKRRVERAALDEALAQLREAMVQVEAAFPAAESAAIALAAALDRIKESRGNDVSGFDIQKIHGAYKRYVMKAHKAIWLEGNERVSAIEDKPFSHFLPDLAPSDESKP